MSSKRLDELPEYLALVAARRRLNNLRQEEWTWDVEIAAIKEVRKATSALFSRINKEVEAVLTTENNP